jgi:hypothetical protein
MRRIAILGVLIGLLAWVCHADTKTSNLGLTLPPLDPADVWGGKLNNNFVIIDSSTIQNRSSLQVGATFYVSSGTVGGYMEISSYTFSHNFGDPAVGQCIFINAANPNTACDFADPGATTSMGSFARIASPIATGRNSYGYYGDDTQGTTFPGRTWGGLFYSANSTYQNIGVEGDGGENSPLSTNIGGYLHGAGPSGSQNAYGVQGVCTGAAMCTGGYFASSSTSTIMSVALDATGGGNVLLSTTTIYGFMQLAPRTLAQLATIVPADVGREYYCSDCTVDSVCISTQGSVAKWARTSSKTTACQ